jgi:type IV pilus assembly protein PilN
MIRMNLLPAEEKVQQRTQIDFKVGEMVIPIIALVVVGVTVAGTMTSQRLTISRLETSIADVETKSRALAPQIERVNRLAQERAELDLRLGVIHRLELGRTASVRLMDEVARCVPDHLWLTNAAQDSPTSLSLEGATFSNLVVSDLMSRLERSAMFSGVELEVAERTKASDKDLVKFRVKCQVMPDAPASEERP